ncbi:MAG: transposase [Deltaproteobacteria bacterium]|nr:transposase [Deltaproteobacteria bacterium]
MPLTDHPAQRNLRKGRFSEEGRAYLITKCTAPGVILSDNPLIAKNLIQALFWMDSQGRMSLGAFVVMADHYHMVVALKQGHSLRDVMGSIGSFTAREINRISQISGRKVWQKGYYDRGIRRNEDIEVIFDYVHNNPVRRGLVDRAEEWAFSSLNPEYYRRIRWSIFL